MGHEYTASAWNHARPYTKIQEAPELAKFALRAQGKMVAYLLWNNKKSLTLSP
jgi:hypothetical protein